MAKNETARVPEKYDVLISFTDDADKKAADGENVYWAGKSKYPRDGYTPPAERVSFLQSGNTRFKKPVIAGKDEK